MWLSLGWESFGNRSLARGGMGVGDKGPVGVPGVNVAVGSVGENEAAQEALYSSPRSQEGTWSLA